MHAVVNHLHLDMPIENLRPAIEAELYPIFQGLAGFKGFYLVKEDDDRAVVVILWESAEQARAGGAAIGPTWFHHYVTPHLASEQQRIVGPVVTSLSA